MRFIDKSLEVFQEGYRLDMEKNIYKISHYYNTNHDKYSVFVNTEIDLKRFINFLGAITFRFEELVPEHDCMDEQHLVYILEKFFDVKDITKECQDYLPYTQLPLSQWEITNTFSIPTEKIFNITQIDWYEAREFCCRSDFQEIMDKVLPKTVEFDLEIKRTQDFYNFV